MRWTARPSRVAGARLVQQAQGSRLHECQKRGPQAGHRFPRGVCADGSTRSAVSMRSPRVWCLLTNDGDFAHAVAHPRFGVAKTYAVLVQGRITRENAEKARGGVWLAEGRTGGARIRVERRGRDRTYLKVQIREGRNREVRRIFARLGHPVISLKRVRIGFLTLHGLGVGKHRFLTRKEISDLLAQAKKGEE